MARTLKQFKSALSKLGPAVESAVMEDSIYTHHMLAEDAIKDRIRTVPSALKEGKIGRIQTGLMYDSVDVSVQKMGAGVYELAHGWINNARQYFYTQEYGGTAPSGKEVWGMGALERATSLVVKHLATKQIVDLTTKGILA